MEGIDRFIEAARALSGLAYLAAPTDSETTVVDKSPYNRGAGELKNGAALGAPGLVDGGAAAVLDGINDYFDTGWKTLTNQIPDPGFEGGGVSGLTTGNCTIANIASALSKSGARLLEVKATIAADMQVTRETAARLDVVAGQPIFAAAEYRPATTARSIRTRIRFFNAEGAEIGAGEIAGPIVAQAAGAWTRATASGTVPAGAVKAVPRYEVLAPGVGEIHYLDETIFAVSSTTIAYFPTPAQLTAGEAGWSGAANASASDIGPFARGTSRTFIGPVNMDLARDFNGLFGDAAVANGVRVGVANAVTLRLANGGAKDYALGSVAAGGTRGVAVTINNPGKAAQLYVDGKPETAVALTNETNGTGTLQVGNQFGIGSTDGRMLPFAVFLRVLSATEILDLYEASLFIGNRSERVVLDPKEVAVAGRPELDLHSGAIRVREEGIDWGQAEVEAFMAQQSVGETVIDTRLPNRIITIPLLLGATGDFDGARIALQAKVARINEEGGWLKREIIGGSYGEAGDHLFCDIVKATLQYGGGTFQALDGVDAEVNLILEAIPDFYGDSIELTSHEATELLAFTEQPIKGSLPGRASLLVTEASANDQRGLAWGFRCRNYSAAETARLAYEAELLTPRDSAAVAELTGASGSPAKVITHPALSKEWTPVLSTNLLAGNAFLTHVGVYDVWARVYTTSAPSWTAAKANTGVYLRFLYDVGDLLAAQANVQVQIPGAKVFYMVHLGQINLRQPPIGTHRWQGQIQARGGSGGEDVSIDKLYLFPADEAGGILRAPPSYDIGLAGYNGRDSFLQTNGLLSGKTAEAGGNWSGAGDAVDFSILAHELTRTEVNDNSLFEGRFGLLGAELTDTVVQVDFKTSDVKPATGFLCHGVFARYAGVATRWLMAQVETKGSGSESQTRVVVNLQEGAVVKQAEAFIAQISPNRYYTIRLWVGAGGQWAVWLYVTGTTPGEPLLTGVNSKLAKGGTHAKGSCGVNDAKTGAAAVTRTYDNFLSYAPDSDAALFASRAASLSWRGHYRQDSTGAAYAPVTYPQADLARIPCSGDEGRPVEIVVRPSRGDFDMVPDGGLDKVAAKLSYRPCWSYVPEL